jgi:hypothetical protein
MKCLILTVMRLLTGVLVRLNASCSPICAKTISRENSKEDKAWKIILLRLVYGFKEYALKNGVSEIYA